MCASEWQKTDVSLSLPVPDSLCLPPASSANRSVLFLGTSRISQYDTNLNHHPHRDAVHNSTSCAVAHTATGTPSHTTRITLVAAATRSRTVLAPRRRCAPGSPVIPNPPRAARGRRRCFGLVVCLPRPPAEGLVLTFTDLGRPREAPQERERFVFRFGWALPRRRGRATDYSTRFVRAPPRPDQQRAINCLGGSSPPENQRRRTVCFVGLRARARRPHDKG